MALILLLLACDPEGAPAPADTAAEAAPVDPVRYLTRASILLRGVRPTSEEYAGATDADAARALAEGWLADPRFGRQVAELWSDRLLTRVDDHHLEADDYGLPDQAAFVQAVGDQPVEMVRHIADADLPWTEAVTGDWTVADPTLAAAWPLEPVADGWGLSRWTDGRPDVGLLAVNGMWWRYDSTESNANRGRAAATARVFLCHDFSADAIPFDRSVSLLDEDAVKDAIATNPGCIACHVGLDPLAAHFFGFLYRFEESPGDRSRYHPDREDLYQTYLGVAPGYYGTPTADLYDLGTALADDPRFVSCAVKTVWTGLVGREAAPVDSDALALHREAFLAGGLTFRALYRSVLADPAFAAGDRRLVTPEQLASTLEGVTGYRGTVDGWDLTRTDLHGYRLLAGGIDGINTSAPASGPIPTLLLVQERLAETAAGFVVDEAQAGRSARLDPALLVDDPDPAAARAALAALAWTTTGEAWTDADLDGLDALRAEVGAADGPAAGWRAALTALLRDPRFLVY